MSILSQSVREQGSVIYMEESWGRRILHLITPLIVYQGMTILIEIAAAVLWAARHQTDFLVDTDKLDQGKMMQAMSDFTVNYSLLIQGIAALISIFILLHMYRRDFSSRRFVFDSRSVAGPLWLLLIPTGIASSLCGNFYLNIGSLAQNSESFAQAEKMLFSGPFVIQLICIGFIIPVCEEFVFRGIIYMRMRQYSGVNMSIVFSALIFGLMHGNLIQGIYAFLLGVLLAYTFEKYGSLAAPVIIHICANLTALAISMAGEKKQ